MTGVIAYGALCTWWDDKGKVGAKPSGLPCCPHCGGVLYEIDEAEWWTTAAKFDGNHIGVEDYTAFLVWLRGRCFPSVNPASPATHLQMAVAAYNAEQLEPGADRDGRPGLRLMPGSGPPLVTEFTVESLAMHSRSRGWLPGVQLTIMLADGTDYTGALEAGEPLVQMIEALAEAMERAHADVDAARKAGLVS